MRSVIGPFPHLAARCLGFPRAKVARPGSHHRPKESTGAVLHVNSLGSKAQDCADYCFDDRLQQEFTIREMG
jgi:hypothetical protein